MPAAKACRVRVVDFAVIGGRWTNCSKLMVRRETGGRFEVQALYGKAERATLAVSHAWRPERAVAKRR